MRIIRLGREFQQAAAPIRTTCRYCGTVFEWREGEGKSLGSDPREPQVSLIRVNCPACAKPHTHTKHPVRIRQRTGGEWQDMINHETQDQR